MTKTDNHLYVKRIKDLVKKDPSRVMLKIMHESDELNHKNKEKHEYILKEDLKRF